MRILAAIALLVTPCLWSQDKEIPKLAPYYPTPETVVDKMLQLGGVKAGEKVLMAPPSAAEAAASAASAASK